MINLKSNLYKNEWLELVFANRNQLYGACELRRKYSARLTKALLLSASLFVAVITGPFLYSKYRADRAPVTQQVLTAADDERIVILQPKPLQKKPAPAQAQQAKPVETKTIKYTVPVVVKPDDVMEELPRQADLQYAAAGTQDMNGKSGLQGAPATGTGIENGLPDAGVAENNEPFTSVQKMPEFPGGAEAFGRYLSKNLRYPALAQENNIQGRIILSFIVEKNGELTDIKVIRGIGGGCDEEAMRILKKAPAWTPGEQNGRKVRVQYTVPILFNLGQ